MVEGVTLTLQVERKRVKNVNARLRDTSLLVSAPLGISQAELEPIVLDLARKLVRRVRAREVNVEEDAVALVRKVAGRFPNPPEVARVLFVTTQQARWGSYSAGTGTIRLNVSLLLMPRWVLEAVVAHELAHVTHLDHSPAFWALARQACADTDRALAFLDGVSWTARHLDKLPPTERALLSGARESARGCE